MIAREWLERGKLADSPIDALTDFWRGFNSLYGHGSAVEIDRIKRYLSNHISADFAVRVISNHAAQVTYLLSQPVTDMRGNGRNTSSAIDAFQENENPLEQLQVLFTIIYQIRCNLEHGQKSPTVDRDLLLCKSSAAIVESVVLHSIEQIG